MLCRSHYVACLTTDRAMLEFFVQASIATIRPHSRPSTYTALLMLEFVVCRLTSGSFESPKSSLRRRNLPVMLEFFCLMRKGAFARCKSDGNCV